MSLIVTLDAVATTVPLMLVVLSDKIKDSAPSVVASFAMPRLITPALEVIVTLPDKLPPVKSAVVIPVPATVQYKNVPFVTPVVAMLKTAVVPSL